MGNVISEEEVEETYSLLPSGEYAINSSQNRHTYNSDRQWNEDAREVERLVKVGNRFCKHGHYDRSLKYYEEAFEIEIHRLGLSENHMSVAITNNNMGIVLNKLGRYEEAMMKYWESLRVKKLKLMKDHVNIAGTLHNMGVVHRNKKEYDMAMACYEDALRIRTMRLGRRCAHSAATIQNMGITQRSCGEYVKALKLLNEALDINRLVLGGDSIEVANVMNDVGKVHFCMKNFDEAMKIYDEASNILQNAKLSKEHVYVRENTKFSNEVKRSLGIDDSENEETEEESKEKSITDDDAFAEFAEARASNSFLEQPVNEKDLLDFVSPNPKDHLGENESENILLDFLSPNTSESQNGGNSHVIVDEPLLVFEEEEEEEAEFKASSSSNKEDITSIFVTAQVPPASPPLPPPCPPTTPAVNPSPTQALKVNDDLSQKLKSISPMIEVSEVSNEKIKSTQNSNDERVVEVPKEGYNQFSPSIEIQTKDKQSVGETLVKKDFPASSNESEIVSMDSVASSNHKQKEDKKEGEEITNEIKECQQTIQNQIGSIESTSIPKNNLNDNFTKSSGVNSVETQQPKEDTINSNSIVEENASAVLWGYD